MRLYFPHRVRWTQPAAQDQTYVGIEVGRLFFGWVFTRDGRPSTIPPERGPGDGAGYCTASTKAGSGNPPNPTKGAPE